jgi:hypothetical protein
LQPKRPLTTNHEGGFSVFRGWWFWFWLTSMVGFLDIFGLAIGGW